MTDRERENYVSVPQWFTGPVPKTATATTDSEREDILRPPMTERADRYLATICRACGRDRHDGTACIGAERRVHGNPKTATATTDSGTWTRFLWPMRLSKGTRARGER